MMRPRRMKLARVRRYCERGSARQGILRREEMAPRIRAPSQRVDGFSKLALKTFREMLALERQCECSDGKCPACRAWWNQHRILHHELELPPWIYPAVE